jgi:hypothetical protein
MLWNMEKHYTCLMITTLIDILDTERLSATLGRMQWRQT